MSDLCSTRSHMGTGVAAILPTGRLDLDSQYQNLLGASFQAKGMGSGLLRQGCGDAYGQGMRSGLSQPDSAEFSRLALNSQCGVVLEGLVK